MAVNNSTVLNKIRLNGSNDYQHRVPIATQSNIREVTELILDPKNQILFNEFVDGLINRIGRTIIESKSYLNPLSSLKGDYLTYGSTVQEVVTNMLKAEGYDIDDQSLFKVVRPDSESAYYSINRQDRYDISIDQNLLRRAFLQETGLNDYIAQVVSKLYVSDNYDEYRIMLQAIAEHHNKWGIFNINTPDFTNLDKDTPEAKKLMKQIQAITTKLRFPSSVYTGNRFPTWTDASDLVILCTPEVMASINVDALAVLFHLEPVDIQSAIKVVDEFPIEGGQLLIADKRAFKCFDVLTEMRDFNNGKQLTINYFYHRWGAYAISPFHNIVLFSTQPDTVTDIVTQDASGFDFEITDAQGNPITNAVKGENYRLVTDVTGTVSSDILGDGVVPDASWYTVTIVNSANTPVSRRGTQVQFVNGLPVLHISRTVQSGDKITVEAKPTYINPSGATTDLGSASVTVTVA